MVILTSSDNENFPISREVAERSVMIKNMIEDVGDSDEPIPIPNVTSLILKKVIAYCEYHKLDPTPEDQEGKKKCSDQICDWDREFIDVDKATLFDIILAANFLDIKSLLDVGCNKVAEIIKGKSTDEICTILNIVNDFTQEEQDKIRKENEWVK